MNLKKLGIIVTTILLTACSQIPETAVKITNLAGNSGGSGSIVETSESYSLVLTNAHVCGVVANGGLVSTPRGLSAWVVSYKVSLIHDLCLIKVSSNLQHKARLSLMSPQLYDKEITSGFPHLLPNVLTEGYFSTKRIIPVMIGFRACTQEEQLDPDTSLFCTFIGRLPIVKAYEAILVTSLIQPGSSGSGVYTSASTIGAVIFAGEGDLGFGFAVPYEFVQNFLTNEVSSLPSLFPNVNISLKQSQSEHSIIDKMQDLCNTKANGSKVCEVLKETLEFSDLIEHKE